MSCQTKYTGTIWSENGITLSETQPIVTCAKEIGSDGMIRYVGKELKCPSRFVDASQKRLTITANLFRLSFGCLDLVSR